MRVLLIIEQCNPTMASVPQLGYKLWRALSKYATVTLCTHGRNEAAIRARHPYEDVVFLHESAWSSRYFRLLSPLLSWKNTNWPLFHTLLYPIYAEFNRGVFKHFSLRVEGGEFDVVHAFTPVMPRYPVKIAQVCREVPFFLGPVNGGVPFPEGFGEVAKKEHAFYNPLRYLCRFLPGYKETYMQASKVWVGSQYTLQDLSTLFPETHFDLMSENGVDDELLNIPRKASKSSCRLLYVGRLEPFKCVDLLIEAVAKLKERLSLTVVGDGSEKNALEKLVKELHLEDRVNFVGWVAPSEVYHYYTEADVFCFPSIRDFGGAVVLEAMAAGLPVIAVNYGGVAEYVDMSCARLVQPSDPSTVIKGFISAIEDLSEDPSLRARMGEAGRERVKKYTWQNKAKHIVAAYNVSLLGRSS